LSAGQGAGGYDLVTWIGQAQAKAAEAPVLKIRYAGGKVLVNFACAIIGGIVAVVVIGSLWDRTALVGGVAGMVVVVAMLLPGAIKRSSRQEPFLTIDGRGVTVDLLGIGTIPWGQIRSTRISGIPWVIGLRLTLEYAGTKPKVGFIDKLNWGVQAKQVGEVVRLTIGFIDMTDQSKQAIEGALSQAKVAAA
jgi:hypothetical protein